MSRSTMPYHRRYHGDALQGYRVLTLEERGAYTTILDLIYDEGGPIDFNERWLAGELGCSTRLARKLIESLLQKQKIYLDRAGRISNRRAENEIENALKISRKRAESGAKRNGKNGESAEIDNLINARQKQLLSKSSIIPVPVPDNNISTEDVEGWDTTERPPGSHLVDSLNSRKRETLKYALTAAALRRSGGH